MILKTRTMAKKKKNQPEESEKRLTPMGIRGLAEELRMHAALIDEFARGYEEMGVREATILTGNFHKGTGFVREFIDNQLFPKLGKEAKKGVRGHMLLSELSLKCADLIKKLGREI